LIHRENRETAMQSDNASRNDNTNSLAVNSNGESGNANAPVAKEKTVEPEKKSVSTEPAVSTRPVRSPLNKEVSIGNTSKKQVAITLDAGSSATQLPQILKILKDNNIYCTFFVTGKWAEQNPDSVKQIVVAGHTLGNHTYDHTDLTTLSDDAIKSEFSRTEDVIKSIAPAAVLKPYFRPPYGARNTHVLQVASDAGYQSIYWTVDALDWMAGQNYHEQLVDANFVKSRIFNNVKNGSIILMHVGDDITPTVLPEVITELKARGYSLVTIDKVL